MNLQRGSTSIHARSDGGGEAKKRLRGRWLLIFRMSWVVLTVLILTLNIAMIPRYDAVLQARCSPGPQCFALQLTAFDRQFLHQFGLSLGFLAAYQVMLDTISVLVCWALGTLLFWRKSSDRVALFCAFMLVLFGGASYTSILQDTLPQVAPAWYVFIYMLDLLGQSSFMIFFLLFPSGRFVPRWTRWIALCVVLYWFSTLFFFDNFQSFWSGPVFVALLLLVVGSQVYRYRRVSTLRERQQTRWVVFGFSIAIVGFVLVVVTANVLFPSLQGSSVGQTLGAGTLLYGFLMLIPISIAMAIMRSQLWDIDIIINKALVYGLLTTLLAAVYAGLIIGMENLVGLISKQGAQPLVIVVSTLVIYALFWPLRRRIQAIIDRRFYRRKYDATHTLDAFSSTLRNEVDLQQLSEHLVAVVQETMQPTHVSLWLRPLEPQQQPSRFFPGIEEEFLNLH